MVQRINHATHLYAHLTIRNSRNYNMKRTSSTYKYKLDIEVQVKHGSAHH